MKIELSRRDLLYDRRSLPVSKISVFDFKNYVSITVVNHATYVVFKDRNEEKILKEIKTRTS